MGYSENMVSKISSSEEVKIFNHNSMLDLSRKTFPIADKWKTAGKYFINIEKYQQLVDEC